MQALLFPAARAGSPQLQAGRRSPPRAGAFVAAPGTSQPGKGRGLPRTSCAPADGRAAPQLPCRSSAGHRGHARSSGEGLAEGASHGKALSGRLRWPPQGSRCSRRLALACERGGDGAARARPLPFILPLRPVSFWLISTYRGVPTCSEITNKPRTKATLSWGLFSSGDAGSFPALEQ